MKKQMRFLMLLLLTVSVGLNWSCKKEEEKVDRELIENYIAEEGLDAAEYGTTGLFYVIEAPGGSKKPSSFSDVVVDYAGYLLDGTQFDQNKALPLNLGRVIRGWQMGIPLIGEGGQIKLIIPSALGYGSQASGDIPANSVLVFDVKLISFN